MCFSASASLTTGIVLTATGAATLPLVRDRRELLFAALPLGFGIHQITEGVIWNQLDDSVANAVRGPAVLAWLLFAWLLLPIWVPISVWLFEPDARRRRWMLALSVIGAGIGIFLFAQAITAPAQVSRVEQHLHYAIPVGPGWLLAIPYLAATCLPLLLSTRRFVMWFGVALTASMAFTALTDALAFSSVWCFFAALLSFGLFAHYLRLDRAGRVAASAAT